MLPGMAKTTFTYTGELTVVECCLCHMDFGLPTYYERDLRRTHDWLYCPAGHKQHFTGTSTEEKLRATIASLEGAVTAARASRDSARRSRDAAERSRAAMKGHLTRMRNRITAGVCPVPGCKRTNLTQTKRHIESAHPAWFADHAHELE